MAGQRDCGQNRIVTRIFISTLVSSLAAGLGGCKTTANTAAQANFNHVAGQSSVQIAPDATVGRYDSTFYSSQAKTANAPGEWVSEANAQSAMLKLMRAEAEGARVEAAANRNTSIAQADEMLAKATALHQIAGFEAERQRTSQDVRFGQLEEEIRAHRTLSEITERSGQIEIGSVMSDLKGQVAMMTAEADAAWSKAQVENNRLHTEYDRVSQQGTAIIDQMNEQVDLMSERADHYASSLEAQSQATRQRASAEAQLLAQQSRSQIAIGKDRQTDLCQQAEFVVSQAAVEAKRLNAQAAQIEASNIEGTFRSAMADAEQSHQWATTRAGELRETAMQQLNAFTAEYTRARQDADYQFATDSAEHQRSLDQLDAAERQTNASFSIAMSKAQEFEFDARETFIRAWMGTDTTGRPVSDVRFDAEQAADGLAAAFRSTTSNDPAAIDILSETDFGDAWVHAVSQADSMRSKAKSSFDLNMADITARRTQTERAFEEAHGTYRNTKAGIAAAESAATSRVEQMFAEADALLEQSGRDYEQARINAESTRDQAVAQARQLRTQATAVVASADSKSAQLRTDSEAAFATAQALANELTEKRDAVLAAAEAQSQQYLAQADLVRSEKTRRVNELNERIAASQSLLNAELARLETVSQQNLDVARLEHEEAMLVASTFDRIGTARVEALAAQNVLSAQDRMNALALTEQNVNTERDLVNYRIDSGLAQADATLDAFGTEDALRRARASALEQIMLAYVEQQHATAEAEESTIVAKFNSRLAQLQAERDRAYAQAYVDRQRTATEQIAAGAPVSPDLSDATLARLEMAAANIRQAAGEAKNILQTAQAQMHTQSESDALEMTEPSGEVANVPTDND